jgi:hypothetical protein
LEFFFKFACKDLDLHYIKLGRGWLDIIFCEFLPYGRGKLDSVDVVGDCHGLVRGVTEPPALLEFFNEPVLGFFDVFV